MKVNIKLSSFDLDKGRYSKTFKDAVEKQMRAAARAFLMVALASVPIRTGFVRGAFKNLELASGTNVGNEGQRTIRDSKVHTFLKMGALFRRMPFKKTGNVFTLSRRTLSEGGATGPFEYYRDGKRRILKTIQSGREFATNPMYIFNFDNFVFTFDFEILINYFNINDPGSNPKTPSSPWKSMERGRAFFLNYMINEGLKRLPQVGQFITESYVTIQGGKLSRTAVGFIGRNTRIRGV